MPRIKINEDFEIERDIGCWIVYIWRDGIKKDTKEKIRVSTELYPSTLMGCFNAILETTAGKASSLSEMKQLILQCKEDIINAIGINCLNEIQNKLGEDKIGYTRGSKDLEAEGRRGKRKSKREEDNSLNETEGTEGKIQTEGLKLNGEVDKKRGRGIRKSG